MGPPLETMKRAKIRPAWIIINQLLGIQQNANPYDEEM